VTRARSGELVLVDLQDNIDELSARMESSADGSAEWDWDTIYSVARCNMESHGESPARHEIEALLDEYNADKSLYEMAMRMKEAGLVERLPSRVLPNAHKHEE
jgi:hypothetical protein